MIQDSAEKGKLKNLILGRRDCHVSLTLTSKIVKYVNFRRVSKVAPWRRNNLFKIYFER